MSRDHRKLRVFHDAHALTIAIYKQTMNFPRDEWYGIRQQLRRAAVSGPTNIVEGSARGTIKDYCNFLITALGSASELTYLVGLAYELGFLAPGSVRLSQQCDSIVRQLQRLVTSVENLIMQEERTRRVRHSRLPQPQIRPQPERRSL